MKQLVEKYRPKTLKEVIGHDRALSELKNFVDTIKKQKNKAVILYGPTGNGKTSAVYALANDIDYEIIELNASDFRNKSAIESIVKNSIEQSSLFKKGKIILIDEIDGLAGREDYGGVSAIDKLLQETSVPIIMVCNDPWDKKLSPLRKKSLLIEFKPLTSEPIFLVLKKIAKEERITIPDGILKQLAIRTKGDIRAAINDLQTLKETKLELEDLNGLSEREKKEDIFDVMNLIFKGNDINKSLELFSNTDLDLKECILWIEENIPIAYTNEEDIARAYDKLSRADVFNGRIRRWQYWRFLVYIHALASAGITASKKEICNSFTKYKRTSRILKIWMSNMKHMKRNSIAKKIAKYTHTSFKRTRRDIMPYFLNTLNKTSLNQLDFLKLDEEELIWLKDHSKLKP